MGCGNASRRNALGRMPDQDDRVPLSTDEGDALQSVQGTAGVTSTQGRLTVAGLGIACGLSLAFAASASAEPRIEVPFTTATASNSVLFGTPSNGAGVALAGCVSRPGGLYCFAATPTPPSDAARNACSRDEISAYATFRLDRRGRAVRGYLCTGGLLGLGADSPRLVRVGARIRIGGFTCALRTSARGSAWRTVRCFGPRGGLLVFVTRFR